MSKTPLGYSYFFRQACYFESFLAVLALVLSWFADLELFASLRFSEPAIALGLIGTIPLILLFFALQGCQFSGIQRIRTLLDETLCPALCHRHWTDLLTLSVIAGFSEELLFRGFLQIWLESKSGHTAGLIVSNLIFGLVHAVTPLYAVLAFLIGIYLGLAMDYGSERNVLTPMVIHGLYDFIVFVIIMRTYQSRKTL
ncbi:MAG: type II CAAX endopeptidase family protein [Methylococcaceae bacterium]|jgi:hypothetical protein